MQNSFCDVLREKLSEIETLAEQEFSRQMAETPDRVPYLEQKRTEIRKMVTGIYQRIDELERLEIECVQETMNPEETENLTEDDSGQDEEEAMTPKM